jgi:hypothetical protein
MKATVILDGDDDEVAQIVGLALAEGVLVSYVTETPDPYPGLPPLVTRPAVKERVTPFKIGDRVKVIKEEKRYGRKFGDLGVVQKIVVNGPKKKAYMVRWDDKTVSRMSHSCLRFVRK